jgi:Protein of unknown function (DUF3489)
MKKTTKKTAEAAATKEAAAEAIAIIAAAPAVKAAVNAKRAAAAAKAKPATAPAKGKATKKATKAKGAAKGPKTAGVPREFSKKAIITGLIERKGGATLPELMKAAGWQVHSVRGFISTLGKTRTIESSKNDAGERCYAAKA